MKNIKNNSIKIVKQAGQILIKEFNNFDRREIKLKYRHEIVTKADLLSEKIIIAGIKKNFPGHEILSEEAGRINGDSDYLWIVDPIDGTTNFSMHNPLWAISVGVLYKREIIFGIIFAPFLKELYIAEKGKGARLNNKIIKVSQTKDGKVLNTFCHGSTKRDMKMALKYYVRQKKEKLDCRQLGSASVELAYVASGRIESIMIPGAKPWDVAAGVLLVREAGGKVTDFGGKEWSLDSRDMIASNGLVHKGILEAVK